MGTILPHGIFTVVSWAKIYQSLVLSPWTTPSPMGRILNL